MLVEDVANNGSIREGKKMAEPAFFCSLEWVLHQLPYEVKKEWKSNQVWKEEMQRQVPNPKDY